MNISEDGLQLIRAHEGLRLKAYLCPAGKWTIGYGHTRGVRPGDTCTKEEAENMLRRDAADVEDAIRHLVKVEITQSQYDALCDFVFNFGGRKFETSTLLRELNAGRYMAAADQFPRWIYGLNPKTGKHEIMNGLVLRREDERDLFIRDIQR